MIIANEYVTATDGKPHFKLFRPSKFYARNIGLLIAELNRQFNVWNLNASGAKESFYSKNSF